MVYFVYPITAVLIMYFVQYVVFHNNAACYDIFTYYNCGVPLNNFFGIFYAPTTEDSPENKHHARPGGRGAGNGRKESRFVSNHPAQQHLITTKFFNYHPARLLVRVRTCAYFTVIFLRLARPPAPPRHPPSPPVGPPFVLGITILIVVGSIHLLSASSSSSVCLVDSVWAADWLRLGFRACLPIDFGALVNRSIIDHRSSPFIPSPSCARQDRKAASAFLLLFQDFVIV